MFIKQTGNKLTRTRISMDTCLRVSIDQIDSYSNYQYKSNIQYKRYGLSIEFRIPESFFALFQIIIDFCILVIYISKALINRISFKNKP